MRDGAGCADETRGRGFAAVSAAVWMQLERCRRSVRRHGWDDLAEGQQYQLTAELALPDADTAVPASKQVSGAAQTMEQAIDDTGAGLDVQLYWSHARVLFLDDTVLSGGIGSCVQELHADSAVRPSVRVCAVRESRAADIFSCQSIGGEPVGFRGG